MSGMARAQKAGETVLAAGGVVLRERESVVEVIVVHRPGHRDWSLPKGKNEPEDRWVAFNVDTENESNLKRAASSELPPSRKKSWSVPTCSTPSTSANRTHSTFSRGAAGASGPVDECAALDHDVCGHGGLRGRSLGIGAGPSMPDPALDRPPRRQP